MAEGFEAYHVPQQSRRDKLRVSVTQNQHGLVEPLLPLPLYDPSSFVSSELISCVNQQQGHNNFHHENQASKLNLGCAGKEEEEGSNLMMRFMNASSSVSRNSSSSVSHHAYLNPEPGAIQVFGSNPFAYNAQNNLREFDQSYNHGGENEINMVFKHEPLFLSLSSHNQGNLPLGLNLERYACGDLVGGGSGSGPFTGYASVLKDSRFLEPTQKLLEETCDVGGRGVCAEKVMVVADASLMEPPPESLSENPFGGEACKKSRLLTMLDEVYRRYRQYYQQMHAVVTSFEYVSGLSNAAPYASLAIKAMSKHFRCLKNAITNQLQFTNKDESSRFGNSNREFLEDQPIWRPQRGLPERAVTVLRAWLYEHFLHPYPTDTDKLMLAKQTGLSRSQVSNWFINARVRLWKPMVEEIHMLETQQAQKDSQKEEHYLNKSSNHFPSDNHSLVSKNPSTSTEKFKNAPYKRTRNELSNLPVRSQELVNLPCTGNQQRGVGVSMDNASNSVSLTLGLYQNHGIGLAEPFPLSAAQRFGLALEANNEGYVMSGLESQSRHFGRDVIGGQMLHDFVG